MRDLRRPVSENYAMLDTHCRVYAVETLPAPAWREHRIKRRLLLDQRWLEQRRVDVFGQGGGCGPLCSQLLLVVIGTQ